VPTPDTPLGATARELIRAFVLGGVLNSRAAVALRAADDLFALAFLEEW
jgi:hypothetical protein